MIRMKKIRKYSTGFRVEMTLVGKDIEIFTRDVSQELESGFWNRSNLKIDGREMNITSSSVRGYVCLLQILLIF